MANEIKYKIKPAMNKEPFVIERTLNAPTERVWSAITNKEKMKQWYFDIAAFEPRVGFDFEFEGGREGRCYVHKCRITEVVEGKKLAYTWRYEGEQGD